MRTKKQQVMVSDKNGYLYDPKRFEQHRLPIFSIEKVVKSPLNKSIN